MKKQTKHNRITNKQILKNFGEFGKWGRSSGLVPRIKPERLARAIDHRGCTAMHYAAALGNYPSGTKIEHLILAESYMPQRDKTIAKKFGNRLHPDHDGAFVNSSPLELAIRNAHLPKGVTKDDLENSKTIYGTGWDMVVKQINIRPPKRPRVPSEIDESITNLRFRIRLSRANSLIQDFPELLVQLNPFKRKSHDKLMTEGMNLMWMPYFIRDAPHVPWLVPFGLKVCPKETLRHLNFIGKEADRVSLLKQFFLGQIPQIKWRTCQDICDVIWRCEDEVVTCLLQYPELVGVLQESIPYRRRYPILKKLSTKQGLPQEVRNILARYPTLLAALL